MVHVILRGLERQSDDQEVLERRRLPVPSNFIPLPDYRQAEQEGAPLHRSINEGLGENPCGYSTG